MHTGHYIVYGGELLDVSSTRFRDPKAVEFVGAFHNYCDAYSAWKAKAQSTVDNALMRFFIVAQ